MKTMAEYFFLRNGFEKFNLEPEVNRQLLIGDRDRAQRDRLLEALEEACYGLEGHKAVVYGDYGRGKTHEAYNLMYEIVAHKLPLVPVYVKCHEYKAKEPFASLFGQMVLGLGTERVMEAARKYEELVQEGKAQPLKAIIQFDDIAQVFRALMGPNADTVRLALRWLGGEQGVKTETLGNHLPSHLSLSRDFSAVMKGLAHMFKETERKVIVYFIDEAERFGLVNHTDTYWSWIGSLRALTEMLSVGYIFYVGAKTRDDVPGMLVWDEVVTRIGASNYVDLLNPSPDELRQWVLELFKTLIRKGPIPPHHADALPEAAADTAVPEGLNKVVGGEAGALDAYPFTPKALEEFIIQCTSQNLANRPREVLKRIQRGAQRAMRKEKAQIDGDILAAIQGDGF